MISFLKRLNEKCFLATHKFFARFNIAWGDASACIRAGCEKYCGRDPSEYLTFRLHQDFQNKIKDHEDRAKSILEDTKPDISETPSVASLIESISNKVSDKEFINFLKELPADCLNEIKAIDGMSQSRLNEFLKIHNDVQRVIKTFKGDNQMTQNEKLRNQAVEMLKDLDLTGAESVQINNTKYDDGSSSFEIGVSFPADDAEETTTTSCGVAMKAEVSKFKRVKIQCLSVAGNAFHFDDEFRCYISNDEELIMDGVAKVGLVKELKGEVISGSTSDYLAIAEDGMHYYGRVTFVSHEVFPDESECNGNGLKFKLVAEIVK